MIVLHETGLLARVECVRSVVAFSAAPNETVLKDNPLGKIPTLVLDDGTALFDSRVICEYLDSLHDGEKLFPSEGAMRFRQLRWLAFADGLTDLLLLSRIERMRPDGPYDVHVNAFEVKMRASFAALKKEAVSLAESPFGIGQIAMVCALGQMDLRFRGSNWEAAHPALYDWYRKMQARPSVEATMIEDDSGPTATTAHDSNSPFTFAEVA
jgi:glutathione S-transferase